MKRLATLSTLLLLSLFVATSCSTARKEAQERFGDEEITTFYLVRHAEKDYGRDPILTPQGGERAERLKEMLKNVDLAAIYSTDTRRTQQTAAPTAADHKLTVMPYNPSQLEEFARQLRVKHRGKSVLVVGHSNTTPSMANYLTDSNDHPRFSELDYTNFYIVNLPRIGAPQVQKLRF